MINGEASCEASCTDGCTRHFVGERMHLLFEVSSVHHSAAVVPLESERWLTKGTQSFRGDDSIANLILLRLDRLRYAAGFGFQ